jgi:hypothetical protein
MPSGCTSVSRGPASQAMESLEDQLPSRSRSTGSEALSGRSIMNLNSLKRTRTHDGAFDLADLEEASKKVEISITFPEIAWPTFGGDDDDSEHEDAPRPSMKRPRLGLVRSSPSFNLVALNSSERINSHSDNSLC